MLHDLLTTTLFRVDDGGRLYISPAITSWEPIHAAGIRVVIDLEGEIDCGVPVLPGGMLYIYQPMYDEHLPDLPMLHATARLAADLIRHGHCVLAHCGMGFNRSALVAGVILVELGMDGPSAVERLRQQRPGALFNEEFARYLATLG